MVQTGDIEANFALDASSSSVSSHNNNRSSHRRKVATAFVLTLCALVLFVTNVHHTDTRTKPEEIVLASAPAPAHPVAAEPAKAATTVSHATGATRIAEKIAATEHPKVVVPHVPSTEERIESVLRKNLDRTAADLAKEQLQPQLIAQGRSVLHSEKIMSSMHNHDNNKPAVHHIQADMTHNSGVKDLDGHHGDLHEELEKHGGGGKPFHHATKEQEEDRTESALRKQLDMETQRKEKEMFQDALNKVHAQFNSKKNKEVSSDFGGNNGKNLAKDSGVSQSQRNEEAALRAQLEASVKAKQKSMYHHAFKSWLEKQQAVKLKKAKKEVTIASREKEMFKATLAKAKEEGPELAKHMAKERREREMGMDGDAKKSHKPSFSTWLKAFKKQLVTRTKEASKKIAEARYTKKAGKTGKVVVTQEPADTFKDAAAKRARAEKAVQELQKALKLEQKEEKAVSKAEDAETTPGKALALLKKTMAKEREALKEISKDEAGVGADPNIAALAPKAPKPKEHDSGILGLDDLGYY